MTQESRKKGEAISKHRGHVSADERFASKLFTDRKEPRIAFWDIYEMARADKDEEFAISFYGIGGEGKTCTLHKPEDEIHEVEHGEPIEDVKREFLRLTAMGISQRGIAASVVSRKLV